MFILSFDPMANSRNSSSLGVSFFFFFVLNYASAILLRMNDRKLPLVLPSLYLPPYLFFFSEKHYPLNLKIVPSSAHKLFYLIDFTLISTNKIKLCRTVYNALLGKNKYKLFFAGKKN